MSASPFDWPSKRYLHIPQVALPIEQMNVSKRYYCRIQLLKFSNLQGRKSIGVAQLHRAKAYTPLRYSHSGEDLCRSIQSQ